MARIRTIKPEFWDSPGTARASLRARLFFIAMWNWADDYGVGTANPKQLVGFAFPNDDDITAKDFPTLRKEVSDCFGAVFFDFEGRPYFTVPSWDKHQRTERKAKRNPDLHEAADRAVLARNHAELEQAQESLGTSDAMQGGSVFGTGEREQGNRGTEEPGNSVSLSDSFESNDEGELLSQDWTPTQKHFDHAVSIGLDPQRELSRFIDHAHRNQRRQKNWNTAFTNWLKKGAEMAQQRQVSGGSFQAFSKPTAGDKARAIADEFRKEGL